MTFNRAQSWFGSRRAVAIAVVLSASAVLSGGPTGLAQVPVPPSPPGPTGVWIDHTGRGAVEIAPCGQGQTLCGRIVWMKAPTDPKGQPLRDGRNPDRTQRTRPICGLQVIGELKPQRDGSWDNGWIYDPEQGESFDVEIRLRAPDLLQVKGYKGLKFLSETFQWQRASAAPQPACPAT